MTNPTRMPTIFVGHGSPMNAIESNRYTQAWQQLGESIGKPSAILAVSAHWYTRGTALTAGATLVHQQEHGGDEAGNEEETRGYKEHAER